MQLGHSEHESQNNHLPPTVDEIGMNDWKRSNSSTTVSQISRIKSAVVLNDHNTSHRFWHDVKRVRLRRVTRRLSRHRTAHSLQQFDKFLQFVLGQRINQHHVIAISHVFDDLPGLAAGCGELVNGFGIM